MVNKTLLLSELGGSIEVVSIIEQQGTSTDSGNTNILKLHSVILLYGDQEYN